MIEVATLNSKKGIIMEEKNILLYKNESGKESEYLLDQEQFNAICKIKSEWLLELQKTKNDKEKIIELIIPNEVQLDKTEFDKFVDDMVKILPDGVILKF